MTTEHLGVEFPPVPRTSLWQIVRTCVRRAWLPISYKSNEAAIAKASRRLGIVQRGRRLAELNGNPELADQFADEGVALSLRIARMIRRRKELEMEAGY